MEANFINQLMQQAGSQVSGDRLARLGVTGDKIKSRQSAEETAQDFEAVFLTQMLQQMYADVEVNEVFGGGHAEEIFRTFLFDEYGKIMAKAGGIGVADTVQKQMLKWQENEK